jgi:hypothetical protein
MKFKTAVLGTPVLAAAYRRGLQALKRSDIAHITCEEPRILTGSVDVETALNRALPNMPLWDYAVGVQGDQKADAIIWIEVHPASSTGEVNTVLSKLNWLKSWLLETAPKLNGLSRKYVWVATGAVAFSSNSPQRRRVAHAGLQFAGRRYKIKAD